MKAIQKARGRGGGLSAVLGISAPASLGGGWIGAPLPRVTSQEPCGFLFPERPEA